MKKVLMRFMIFAIACLVVLFSGCADERGTKGLTKEYFEDNIGSVLSDAFDFESVFGNENPFKVLFDDSETVGITLEADLNKLFGKDAKLSFGADIDYENKRGNLNMSLKVASYESIDFMLFADREKLLLSSDAIFGRGNVYSLEYRDFDKLKSELANSYIADLLGITKEEIYAFCDEYEINKNYFENAAHAVSEYLKYYEDFSDITEEIFLSGFEKSCNGITEEKIEQDGNLTDVLILNAVIQENFAEEIIDEYIKEYTICAEKQAYMIEAIIPKKIISDWNFDTEAFKKGNIELMRTRLEQIAEQIDFTAELNIYLDKKNGILRKITADNDGYRFTVYFDDEITAEYSSGEKLLSSGRIYHTEDAGIKAYGFELSGANDPLEKTEGRFEILKFENQYNLYVRMMYGNEIMSSIIDSEGYFIYGEDSFDISPRFVSFGYEMLYPGISFGVSRDALIVEYKKHKSIFTLSENEVRVICDRAASAFSELFGALADYEYENSEYMQVEM